MVSVTGANPDELDRLAASFTSTATKVADARRALNPKINTAPWRGRDADRFRHQWSNEHRRAIDAAIAFLNQGANDLHANAQQQRQASKDGGAGRDLSALYIAPKDGGGTRDGGADDADAVVDLLRALGLSSDQIKKLLDSIGDAKSKLGLIADILDDKETLAFLKAAGKVLDAVDVVIDFVTDLAENAGTLATDELIVHAVVETAIRYAVDEGAGKVVELITPFLMSAIPIPVASTAAGVVIGKVIGYVVNQAVGAVVGDQVDQLDRKYNIYDGPADAAVDGYKYLKEHDFNVTDIAIDKAKDIAGDVVDGAQDWAGDRVDDAKDLAGDVGDGVKKAWDWAF